MTFSRQEVRFALLLILLFCLSSAGVARAQILHLEIGAANESGQAKNRFKLLNQVLLDIVKKYGSSGTIYINDIDEIGLDQAADFIRNWVKKRNLRVKVVKIPGDMFEVNFPRKLTSVNLNNPIPNVLDDERLPGILELLSKRSKDGVQVSTFYFEKPYFDELASAFKLKVRVRAAGRGYTYYWPNKGFGSPDRPHGTRRFILEKSMCSELFSSVVVHP